MGGKKMEYKKTEKYNTKLINQKIMGPNPLKLEEELMKDNSIKTGSTVMDLGSGQGITSIFLVKEYGFKYMQLTFGVIQKKIKIFLLKWD